jgi:glycosyltransferase involved in cell wall biosynthesis
MWDYKASKRPDYLIANSIETQKRIEKFYRRDSIVIYPPVSIPSVSPNYQLLSPNYYITVSRLARAKHVDILIEAANREKFELHIVGVGRDERYLKSLGGPTVKFLGNLSDEELQKELQRAKAYLFSAVDEEFGIAPVEAMGYGVPVIAYASGGLLETVKPGVNGYLFSELTADSILHYIKIMKSLSEEQYLEMRKSARREAEQYSEEKFKHTFMEFVKSKISR